jgi:hypothetical protein
VDRPVLRGAGHSPSRDGRLSTPYVAAPHDEGYFIDSIDPLMLMSDAKHRVSKHEGINPRVSRRLVSGN